MRLIITYASVAWSQRTNLATARNNLSSKVQRLACICITAALRTYPTAAIEVVSEQEIWDMS